MGFGDSFWGWLTRRPSLNQGGIPMKYLPLGEKGPLPMGRIRRDKMGVFPS